MNGLLQRGQNIMTPTPRLNDFSKRKTNRWDKIYE